MICFDHFCREVKQCRHYVEWDYTDEVFDHGNRCEIDYECCSCELVGESHNVDEYNEFCIYLKEIKVYEVKMLEELRKYELQQEKQKAWRILNDIT